MSLRGTAVAALSVCVLALGLAGCEGDVVEAVETALSGKTAEEQRDAVKTAIEAADDAVDAIGEEATSALLAAAERAVRAARETVADADALTGAERSAFGTALSLIEDRLADAGTGFAADEVARLRAALDGAPISAVAATVEHGAAPVLSARVPGSPAVAGLEVEAVAGSTAIAGGWVGATYGAADEAAGTADTIVFHSDIEPPGSRPFSGDAGKYSTANGLDADGNLPIVAATDATLIASPDFPDGPGIRTHEAGNAGSVSVAGTFDGAAGDYVCAPAMDDPCTSSLRAGGGIALEGGAGWIFVPDAGATVASADAVYSWFGWWQREAGGSYAFGAFHGGEGGEAADFANFARLVGTARYSGPAAGKFVLDPPIGEAMVGEFTATATLEVDFGDAAGAGGVTGTVENFAAGGRAVDWSVALGAAALGADGRIGAGATVWSIGGREGAAAGSPAWSGRFRDVDRDQVPRTATGSFTASYDDFGRMTGAFGTHRRGN